MLNLWTLGIISDWPSDRRWSSQQQNERRAPSSALLRRLSLPVEVAMHLRVRPLLILIELFLLIVVEEAAHPTVGLQALGPHLSQTLFVRQAFVLHELLRRIMQLLEDRLNFGLLITGKFKFPGQHLQLFVDGW